MKYIPKIVFIIILSMICQSGCKPKHLVRHVTYKNALVPVRICYPDFKDDMDINSLKVAIEQNLKYLNRLSPETIFHYGADTFTCSQIKTAQELFLNMLMQDPDQDQLNEYIRKNFIVYRAIGQTKTGKTLFTGYFEPVLQARLNKNRIFKYPIYKKPDDLINIDLSPFGKQFRGKRIVAKIEGKKITPYYSRSQIDTLHVLDGKNLEIAWLKNPIDRFFLHIQGSGKLLLPENKTIQVGYAASNGLPYRSIGRYMFKKGYLTRDKLSMQNIRKYISQYPETADSILNHNPSYVFFRILPNGPLGNINVPLTPGRSIALDSNLFPKGALGFISCQKPIIDSKDNIVRWERFSRFVVNQDTGGAIKGAGRADIFWGSGKYARIVAGHLKHEGELYIMMMKGPQKKQ